MNHEVEREVGELAKLRLFYERVMALPRHHAELTCIAVPTSFQEASSGIGMKQVVGGYWVSAADIDAIDKEVGSE